jgi:hypothetical protein
VEWAFVVEEVGLWVGVGLPVCLIEWRLLPLFLLVKDIDHLPELYLSYYFLVNVLPSYFSPLSRCLPFGYSLLLLMEPLNILMYSGELLFFCGFVL